MKKIYSILLSVVAASMLFSACDPSDFGDINKDPNSPSTPFTSYLFTMGCTYVPWFVLGDATNGYDPWQQEWSGYFSESKNNQYGPLGTTVQYSRGSTIYLYALRNLQQVIELNEDESTVNDSNVGILGTSANQIAAAKTLQAYYFMSLTDIQGPIVMSQAFKGKSEDNWTPEYDSQEQVYTQLDDMLKEAYAMFDESGTLNSAADVLFAGNIAKWKKLNASLRMLAAIKLCDVAPAVGKSRFAAAYADGGMESADDDFTYTYDDLTWNRLYYWVSPDYSGAGFNAVPNKFIVDAMKERKDNRMWAYFDIEGYKGTRKTSVFPRDQYTSFYGVPFGLESNTAVNEWSDCCASINSNLIGMSATIPVIPAARVLLTEAEAAYRGWISADPATLYAEGIKVSFDQWGVEGASAYIANNPYDGLESIAIQRWIASYCSDGVETWSDWRRLDIPHMPIGPGAVEIGNKHYPYRLAYYTDTDVAYNYDNYVKAVAQLSSGNDDTSARVWWDVADNWEGVLSEEDCKPQVVIPADWQARVTGTMNYGYYYYGGDALFADHAATLYEDVNHEGKWKIAPYGNQSELLLDYDAADQSFHYAPQIVGKVSGYDVRASDWDNDQGTDHSDDPSYRGYYDDDEQAWLFMTIWRYYDNAAGKWTLTAYGYDALIPDE